MNIVTGAFGYIGRYIARHLLDVGEAVRTITTHPNKPNPFGDAVEAFPYSFDDPEKLVATLRGGSTLYNTYWIRFEYGGATFEQAVRNTVTLFECAKKAGVGTIVHMSVTNASVESRLPYYRGKALQEHALIDSEVSYVIVRPTLVFGKEDILVNNIAWLIRHFPFFPLFGDGKYKIQPVDVQDLARIAVEASRFPTGTITDAVGPESFTFDQFVALIIEALGSRCRPVRISPTLGIGFGKLIGLAVGDILLTSDELRGLMSNLLISDQKPNGVVRFSEWLKEHRDLLGATYSSEVRRHFRWR